MSSWTDIVIAVFGLSLLLLVATRRMVACVKLVALQGVALALLPLMLGEGHVGLRALLLAGGSFAVKGLLIPWLLLRTLERVQVKRIVEPYVGFTLSLFGGVLAAIVSFWVASRVPLPTPPPSRLIVPAALLGVLTGLFVIVSRRKALTQVIGYLVLENGIQCFGLALVGEVPMLVELGVMLDAVVAVLVMGIAVFQINAEFDHMDVSRLRSLKG
jgi:hydrogenase-4 component E